MDKSKRDSYALPIDITRLRLEGHELVFSESEFDYWLPALVKIGIVKIMKHEPDIWLERGNKRSVFHLLKTVDAPVGFVSFTDTLLRKDTCIKYSVQPRYLEQLLIWLHKTHTG